MRIAVLASGTGTILDAMVAEGLAITVVVADRPCGALSRAEGAGIEALLVARDDFSASFDRETYTHAVVEALVARRVELVAMAGFGTIFGSAMQDAYGGRIINTHPSLLPEFPGWHAVRDALAAGATVTGCTVHVAGLEVDTGPVLAQQAVEVHPDDDEASLAERIKAVERRLYPRTIADIIERGSVPCEPS